VVDFYNALVAKKENAALSIEQRREKNGWMLTRSGTREATIDDLRLVDAHSGDAVSMARTGQRLRLELIASAHVDIPRLVLGFMIRDKQGSVIWGSNTFHTSDVAEDVRDGQRVRFLLDFECTLGPGSYSVSPALVSSDTHMHDNYEWVDNLLVFDVMNADRPIFIGSTWLDASFRVERMSASDASPFSEDAR
jgi:lipopolysaccharide transport system ATP-binding protein